MTFGKAPASHGIQIFSAETLPKLRCYLWWSPTSIIRVVYVCAVHVEAPDFAPHLDTTYLLLRTAEAGVEARVKASPPAHGGMHMALFSWTEVDLLLTH